MKIMEFEYKKADGSVSTRKVMLMRSIDDGIEAIDFKYLSEEEHDSLIKAQQEYEKIMRPLTEKAIRRFKSSRMMKIRETVV